MQDKSYHKLLSCVLEILKMMIESGAEIYRVEESANIIFRAYGIKNADVYATTSNIIVSLETEDGEIKTHTRRISGISTNIEKIHRLNSLVRKMSCETPSVTEIRDELDSIYNAKNFSGIVNIIVYGVIAGAFYFFFGGRHPIEAVYSVLIGLVTGVINTAFEKLKPNKILIKFICSFTACTLIFILYKLALLSNVDYLIIANIMTLIPGVGLTNALRDLFVGDSVSGVLRMIEAALFAIAIASGYLAVSFIFGGVI